MTKTENGAKFAVLSPNPCIDRQIKCEKLRVGELNRVGSAVVNYGGKGTNAAMMLGRLGADVSCFMPANRDEIPLLEEFFGDAGVKCRFYEVGYELRQNLKIIDSDGNQTEINERGGVLPKMTLAEMTKDILDGGFTHIFLCGSLPQGVDDSAYRSIIEKANKKGIVTVLDCDKEALTQGFSAHPSLVKPNEKELEALLRALSRGGGEDRPDCSELIEKCKAGDAMPLVRVMRKMLGREGEREIVLTLGENGSVYVSGGGVYRVSVPRLCAKGFAGAGDTYLAAYVFMRAMGEGVPEALRFASAASLAKICLEGTALPDIKQIKERLDGVLCERIILDGGTMN